MHADERKRGDKAPKDPLERLFGGCTDCDICRFLMDESCLVFPEIFRRFDEALVHRRAIHADDLRDLIDRCTLCGLCPCPDVRANLIEAKAARVRAEGMEPAPAPCRTCRLSAVWDVTPPGFSMRCFPRPRCVGFSKRSFGYTPGGRSRPLPPKIF